MIQLDKDCFMTGIGSGPGHEPGMSPISHGELVDIIYRKIKSNKWFVLLFPWSASTDIYKKIEETYYKPGSGRNAGFELAPLIALNTIAVFCYKEYMNEEQLSQICNCFLPKEEGALNIPNGRDFIVVTNKGESPFSMKGRIALTADLVDYYRKQETGT